MTRFGPYTGRSLPTVVDRGVIYAGDVPIEKRGKNRDGVTVRIAGSLEKNENRYCTGRFRRNDDRPPRVSGSSSGEEVEVETRKIMKILAAGELRKFRFSETYNLLAIY